MPSLKTGEQSLSVMAASCGHYLHRFSDAGYYNWLLAKSCLGAANKIPKGNDWAARGVLY